jgi:hypothetical protein
MGEEDSGWWKDVEDSEGCGFRAPDWMGRFSILPRSRDRFRWRSHLACSASWLDRCGSAPRSGSSNPASSIGQDATRTEGGRTQHAPASNHSSSAHVDHAAGPSRRRTHLVGFLVLCAEALRPASSRSPRHLAADRRRVYERRPASVAGVVRVVDPAPLCMDACNRALMGYARCRGADTHRFFAASRTSSMGSTAGATSDKRSS